MPNQSDCTYAETKGFPAAKIIPLSELTLAQQHDLASTLMGIFRSGQGEEVVYECLHRTFAQERSRSLLLLSKVSYHCLMHYIDSHAHLSSAEVLPSIGSVIERAKTAGITHMLNICTDLATLQAGLDLNLSYPFVKNAGATTPHDVEAEGELAFASFERAARDKKLCAIGETGLDYHYQYSPRELQKQFLIRYLHLAAQTQLPVIFHCREAFADLFEIVDREYPCHSPAVLHCFTGTIQEAEEVLSRGWYLSLSGIVTFKKSEALREVAKIVPLSQLLIETDTPYLAPQTQRGKMNEPSFLPEVARCIAAVKGISEQEVARATSENGKKLFF